MKIFKKTGVQQLASVVLSVIILVIGAALCKYTSPSVTDTDFEKATVTEIIAEQSEKGINGTNVTIVVFDAEITSGENKGKIFKMTQRLDEMLPPVPVKVSEGDRILVTYTEPQDESSVISGWAFAGVNHTVSAAVLVAFFLLLILLIGRKKGVATIISLVITVAAVFFIYIPAVLLGRNIYVYTILITLFIIFSTLAVLNGWNKKTLCAIVGNALGVLASGVLAFFINRAFGITGVLNQDYLFLTMLEGGVSINLPALIWGGILIGSLGAVMDVAMSLASSVCELSEQMYEPSLKKLVVSGMNIGKDAIGTMTNTLILAYVGGSMATILLFFAYTSDIVILLNYEMLAVELIQAVVGSTGILLAVPITVLFSSWIYTAGRRKKEKA